MDTLLFLFGEGKDFTRCRPSRAPWWCSPSGWRWCACLERNGRVSLIRKRR